jgi:hypothetical protein
MIKNNNTPFNIKVEDFDYQINNNYIVIIDFGQQMDKRGLRTYQFYNSRYKKGSKYIYESEVFIVYYHCYKIFFNINDKWSEKYDKVYYKFVNDVGKNVTTKDFDRYIIKSLLNLKL